MNSSVFFSFLLYSAKLLTTGAWVTGSVSSRQRLGSTCLFQVQSVSLDSLSQNHEEEGALMATSITKWLDAEWIPQEVHVKMAESAKKSYVAARLSKEDDDDIMNVMMKVANDLDKNWKEYDADAFVNAWDVANYVSDYLTSRAGGSGDDCECSATIH